MSMRLLFAYLDAGSGALLLQLVFGGAAGLVAFFKLRWRAIVGKQEEVGHAPEEPE